jgi:hypothetical protein
MTFWAYPYWPPGAFSVAVSVARQSKLLMDRLDGIECSQARTAMLDAPTSVT